MPLSPAERFEAMKAAADGGDWTTVLALAGYTRDSDPEDPHFCFFVAKALKETGEIDHAARIVRRGAAAAPASEWGALLEFEVLLANERIDEAFSSLHRSIRDHPTEMKKATFVQFAVQHDRLSEALEVNETRLVVSTRPRMPRFALALQCFAKVDTLRDVFRKLIELNDPGRVALVVAVDAPGNKLSAERWDRANRAVMELIGEWLPRLTQTFPSVQILRNRRNFGPAVTCRHLLDTVAGSFDGFLFIEDDCLLAPDALDWTIHHLRESIELVGPWFLSCESPFFDAEGRPLDPALKPRLSAVARHPRVRDAHSLVDHVPSTCFGTTSEIWHLVSPVRSFVRGPESLTRFMASMNRKTLVPVVPRASDIGMFDPLGYSMTGLGTSGVRETKNSVLVSGLPFDAQNASVFEGNTDDLYLATSLFDPTKLGVVESFLASLGEPPT